jgi:hypothetical protein
MMTDLFLEIGFLALLGLLYYFYQRKKILRSQENTELADMSYVLHAVLNERTDEADPEADALIEALDDFISNKTSTPPRALLRVYADSPKCSPELRALIHEALS